MRTCGNCQKQDAPWFAHADCNCPQKDIRYDDDPSPLKHAPDCNGIGHEVALYPVRMDASLLTWEKKLPASWVARGWALKQNGGRWYRVKMLCRGCIELEETAQERQREYEQKCRETRGIEALSYAQMLANQ
jgi:hypothetical protein